jgi:hypothetical protein
MKSPFEWSNIMTPREKQAHIRELASRLVESITAEDINDKGEGTVTVDAKAFGDLDVAIQDAKETA